MTVRIAKQPVNLREKLSELERPIGVKGNQLMRAETAQDARDLVSAGRKNLLINGDFTINQRGLQDQGGTTNLASGITYGVDRWFWNQSAGSTFRMATTTDVPFGSGFKNSLRLTLISVGSLGSSTYHFLRQKIEGFNTVQLCWGTSKAKPVTLSFWVKSSIAASNHCVYVGYQGVGIYPVLYSIDNADTWEYKTITIPGATSGTWSAGTSGSVEVEFDFGTGSTYSAPNNVWTYGGNYFSGTGDVDFAARPVNSTWYVTGVQLEVGKNATEFEYRSYGEELALCQRYFYRFRCANQEWIYNEGNLNDRKWHQFYIGHPMRVNPSVDVSNLATGGSIAGMSGVTISSISPQTPGDTPGRISSRVIMSGAAGSANNLYHTDVWQNNYISLSAEL